MLQQTVVLENLVLTGLRGVGKTVLFDTFKPMAQSRGWLWAGTDLSESSSISEEAIATRLLADVATATSNVPIGQVVSRRIGFGEQETKQQITLTYTVLRQVYDQTPGLIADKLKAVLELAWEALQTSQTRGIVFAYDEAQNLADQAQENQFPLSLLLDVFQSLQKKGVCFMLALTGLPTLFPKLVEARTFAERMFRVVFLSKLNESDSRDAITKPMSAGAVRMTEESVNLIVKMSGGYPYFIQFMCREVFDIFIAALTTKQKVEAVPTDAILRRLDSDFFAGRWARVTDRQRDLLFVVAKLDRGDDDEFSVQDVVEQSNKQLGKPFGASHVNQMLVSLTTSGLIYKNRHGKYSFAVPLFGQFVLRQMQS